MVKTVYCKECGVKFKSYPNTHSDRTGECPVCDNKIKEINN